ncbi:hypothetical protein DSECCO2_654490 [anaerobic digester metagenome]
MPKRRKSAAPSCPHLYRRRRFAWGLPALPPIPAPVRTRQSRRTPTPAATSAGGSAFLRQRPPAPSERLPQVLPAARTSSPAPAETQPQHRLLPPAPPKESEVFAAAPPPVGRQRTPADNPPAYSVQIRCPHILRSFRRPLFDGFDHNCKCTFLFRIARADFNVSRRV